MIKEVVLANAWSKVSGAIIGLQTGELDTGGVGVVMDIRMSDNPRASLRWVISKEGGSVIARTAMKSVIYNSMQDALAGLAPLSPIELRNVMHIADGTSCRLPQEVRNPFPMAGGSAWDSANPGNRMAA